MKRKIVSGIMLTLLLVSMLTLAFNIQAVRAEILPLRGDVNHDGIINILDIVVWANAFGSQPGNPRWNPAADLNQDGLINIFDGIMIGVNFGVRWIPGEGLVGEISIGAILSLSGDLATYGENHKVAIDLATEEVNEFLQAVGATWTLKIITEDSMTDPAVALTKLESLHARGIKFIIGPMFSDAVSNIKGYADANEILVISQSSTRPGLNVPDDFLFRFCPNDFTQGRAIARLMYDDGKRYVIPVTRNDAWGVGLEEAVRTRFEELGGTFLTGIRYDPAAVEFSSEAAALDDSVTDAIATYGADQVAVLHISFEEVNAFMTACSVYPVLDDVKWYGSDGTTRSWFMLQDEYVRDFAMSVEYPSPLFAPTRSDRSEKVRQHCIDVLGREPDSYAYIAYDVVWVYAYSLMTVDAYDSEAVRAVLPTVAQNYFGASGWIVLDENGDREGDYDIWQITEISPGTYEWTIVGTYIQVIDSVVWY